MEATLKFYREDGTFVADINGLPYHVTHEDPLHEICVNIHKETPVPLEPEPVFEE